MERHSTTAAGAVPVNDGGGQGRLSGARCGLGLPRFFLRQLDFPGFACSEGGFVDRLTDDAETTPRRKRNTLERTTKGIRRSDDDDHGAGNSGLYYFESPGSRASIQRGSDDRLPKTAIARNSCLLSTSKSIRMEALHRPRSRSSGNQGGIRAIRKISQIQPPRKPDTIRKEMPTMTLRSEESAGAVSRRGFSLADRCRLLQLRHILSRFRRPKAKSGISLVDARRSSMAPVSRADLNYDEPARRSEEGMPVGNGTMGSLVKDHPDALDFRSSCRRACSELRDHSFPRINTDYAVVVAMSISASSTLERSLSGSSFRQH